MQIIQMLLSFSVDLKKISDVMENEAVKNTKFNRLKQT